mmetsp:Transcript_63181/g.199876  ORF Transcript_63181/g.199876 Transcript_63181/m.199876 type:complete len:472 (+) Transcript_63181:386-1801(+)
MTSYEMSSVKAHVDPHTPRGWAVADDHSHSDTGDETSLRPVSGEAVVENLDDPARKPSLGDSVAARGSHGSGDGQPESNRTHPNQRGEGSSASDDTDAGDRGSKSERRPIEDGDGRDSEEGDDEPPDWFKDYKYNYEVPVAPLPPAGAAENPRPNRSSSSIPKRVSQGYEARIWRMENAGAMERLQERYDSAMPTPTMMRRNSIVKARASMTGNVPGSPSARTKEQEDDIKSNVIKSILRGAKGADNLMGVVPGGGEEEEEVVEITGFQGKVMKLVFSEDFEVIIILLIFANCISLALLKPLEPEDSPWNTVLSKPGAGVQRGLHAGDCAACFSGGQPQGVCIALVEQLRRVHGAGGVHCVPPWGERRQCLGSAGRARPPRPPSPAHHHALRVPALHRDLLRRGRAPAGVGRGYAVLFLVPLRHRRHSDVHGYLPQALRGDWHGICRARPRHRGGVRVRRRAPLPDGLGVH